ncbi:MAG: ankyrin repeat domain-containing protein [Leptospiraceae bacterium]|nr:ankyrin repeat domain-containing protein [Leptospiraceae bacterium]
MKFLYNFFFLTLVFFSISIFADSNIDLLKFANAGNLDGVKKAIQQKANINFKDSEGTTALMFAANNDHFPIVKYLVDNNADVLAKNNSGWTASILAGVRRNKFTQKYLEEIELNIQESRVTGIILAITGNVYVENKKLQLGDRILEKQTIFLEKNATCDLQIKNSESEFNIRLRENSVFTFQFKEQNGEKIFYSFLKQGSMLVKVGNVFPGEQVRTLTPISEVYFNGSSVYEVNVDKEENSRISVYAGVVKLRIRAKEIEENNLIENSPEIKLLIYGLEKNEQIIMRGSYVDLPQKKQKEILEKANSDTLYKRATWEEFSTEVIPVLSLPDSEKPVIKNLTVSNVSAKEKEAINLLKVDPAKLKNTSESIEILDLIKNRK